MPKSRPTLTGKIVNFVLAVDVLDEGDLRSRRVDDQGVGGNENGGSAVDEVEAHFGEGAGQERAIGIGHADFRSERAGGGVERARVADDFAVKNAVGISRDMQIGLHAGLDGAGVGFRHIDVEPQGIGLRDAVNFGRAVLFEPVPVPAETRLPTSMLR